MNLAEPPILQAPAADSPFNVVLNLWARWMRLRDSQYSESAAHPQDTKEFMALGQAVNAMVDDLPRYQWWAIYKSKGICTVWRFPEQSFADALQQAEEKLMPKLMAHIATRRYFD